MNFAQRRQQLPRMGAGLGYRGPLRAFFETCRREGEAARATDGGEASGEASRDDIIRCVEVVAEHFFSRGAQRPTEVGQRPVLVHCLDFSLGTPGALDETYLERASEVLRSLSGALLSDHLAFTRTGEVELGHLCPVPPTRKNAKDIAGKIRDIQSATDVPFLLENITTHLSVPGDLRAAEFYQQVVDEADCGMLLDVTNILVNCRNRDFDPMKFIEELDLTRVVQLHIVGYSERGGTLYDSHVEDISDDLFALAGEVIARAPVAAVIVERDGHWPHANVLRSELNAMQALLDAKEEASDHG